VRGVLNLRGAVVPVIDLAIQFGQPPCTPTKLTCVVVVEVALAGELAVMGLIVDSVHQTMELDQDQIGAVPSFGTVARAEYLTGMAHAGKKFVLLLDLDHALSAEQLYRTQAAAQALAAQVGGAQPAADAGDSREEDGGRASAD
jgi:purine-binding chemotaxis protein CheW